jgi:drug/metabolite transporter (DMT)-like permease
MFNFNSFSSRIVWILPLLLVNVSSFSSIQSRTGPVPLISSSPCLNSQYQLNIAFLSRIQNANTSTSTRTSTSLFAIKDNSLKKQRSRKTDVPPLHASAFLRKEEKTDSTKTTQKSYEIDLLRQKEHYDDLIKGTASYSASIHAMEEIEEAIIQEPQSTKLSGVWVARMLLLLSAALYGTNFTFVKILNENVPVQDGTILRFSLAALATFPMLLQPMKADETQDEQNEDMSLQNINTSGEKMAVFLGDLIPSSTKYVGTLLAGFEVGCWTALGYVAQAIGLETTQASTSAFICSLAVVVVPILDLLSGKKLSSRTIIGALMAVAGVAFLELDGLSIGNVMDGGAPLFSEGDLYSLMQPLAFGMGFWRMEHAMRRYPTEAMKLTAAQLLAVAGVSVVSCIGLTGIEGLPTFSQILTWVHDPLVLGSIFWTGLITTALTIYMETLALKTLSAAETTMIFSSEPIFGSLFAGFVLGESFGAGGVAGAAMIVGACIYSNLQLPSKEEPDLVADNKEL